jgi:polar amino acid transport system substrate-binding protein
MKRFILILLLILTSSSYAQKINLVTELYSPFQIIGDDDQLTGFAIELVEIMNQKSGIETDIQVYPWARSFEMAKTIPNTFIFSISRTPERKQMFKWIGDYYTSTDALYSLASREDIKINSITDAKKYITAATRRGAGEQRLEKLNFTKDKLVITSNQEQSLQMLIRGRVDLITNNDLNFFKMIEKFGYTNDHFKKAYSISTVNFGIAAHPNTDVHLINKMKKALEDIKTDGTHGKLMEKWFPIQ